MLILHPSTPPISLFDLFTLLSYILLFICPCCPNWTPLPLLPKSASQEWAWLVDVTLVLVSVGRRGRGVGGGQERQYNRWGGSSYVQLAEAAFNDSLFCNCPSGPLSSLERRLTCETRLHVGRLSHTLTDTHFDTLGSVRKCVSWLKKGHTGTHTSWSNISRVESIRRWDGSFSRVGDKKLWATWYGWVVEISFEWLTRCMWALLAHLQFFYHTDIHVE